MNESEKYDIEARAFQLMTGFMAPGKDSPAAAGPTDMAERRDAWSRWKKLNNRTIWAMLKAFEEHTS